MYRIDGTNAKAALDAPTVPGPNPDFYFTEGNPGTGTPATRVAAEWLNMVQEEIAQVIADGGGTLDKADRAQLSAAISAMITANSPGTLENLLFNSDFRINQRAYVSAAALATGVYGHDRWKAGASGGDYSFAQLAGSTQITIAAGKTLIQVVEAGNVPGGDLTLSWEGTAQGRVGIDSATPSGAYAASPITITTQSASTVMSVEFEDGTLGEVRLGRGLVAHPFEPRPIGGELVLCHRYFFRGGSGFAGVCVNTTTAAFGGNFPTTMRAIPSISMNTTTPLFTQRPTIAARLGSGSVASLAALHRSGLNLISVDGFTSLTANEHAFLYNDPFDFDAEL